MKFFTTASLLLATVMASPTVCAAKPPKEFRLKTHGAENPAHNNLWVYTYHTGAGFNDAVLDKNGKNAPKVLLNHTRAEFQLGTDFPWGMMIYGDTNYASWEPVEINAGTGSGGFAINATDGFVASYENGFGGWLVCEWFHNAPQLFWLSRWYEAKIPCSCSEVKLKPVYD